VQQHEAGNEEELRIIFAVEKVKSRISSVISLRSLPHRLRFDYSTVCGYQGMSKSLFIICCLTNLQYKV
jgi:hypothetical protein